MTASQSDRAKRFRALHEQPGAFVIANPWDAGSARILAGLGFPALATSSGASAADTIRLAAETGLVGGSIEDASGNKDKPLWDQGSFGYLDRTIATPELNGFMQG